MDFTNFCCRSGGSNLNAGTRTGNSTVPGTAANFTYASGTWVASTGVFTVASGDPAADGVAVGDFASVYADGSALTNFVGRVTARDATTITVSLTAKSGTAPTDGTNTRTLKIGGAWKGPNAAEGFPFVFADSAMENAAGDSVRINLMNDASYAITATMGNHAIANVRFEGFTTAYGDGGRATIDGGTAGASYALLTLTALNCELIHLIFANNGATGATAAFTCSGQENLFHRCVFRDMRGSGLSISAANNVVSECEFYGCNIGNAASGSGFQNTSSGVCKRCIFHDNAGTNTSGVFSTGNCMFVDCIFDTNGQYGLNSTSTTITMVGNCDFYNNVGDGLRLNIASSAVVHIESCNFVKNGGYGINFPGAGIEFGRIANCGYGAGTQANTSGATNGVTTVEEVGAITYASDVTPWVDPANGDFRVNLAAAINAGRGAFTQTAASYAGAVSYPDVGSNQHLEAAGAAGMLYIPGMAGGMEG